MFVLLIVVHELGHFIVARRNGVEAEEFGIFFPPRLWSRKTKKGWIFSVNALPLGGFVRLKGEFDSDSQKGGYGAASVWVKTKILLAGVGMNLVVCFVLLTLLGWLGMPQLLNNQFQVKSDAHYIQHGTNKVIVAQIEPNSPAVKAGIKSNDTLLALGRPAHLNRITNANNLPALTKSYAGQTVEVRYQADNRVIDKTVTLRSQNAVNQAARSGIQLGYLGLSAGNKLASVSLVRSTWSAPINAVGLMVQYTGATLHGIGVALKGLGSIIAGLVTNNHAAREAGQTAASGQIAGPIGIFAILKAGTALGYQFELMFIALISLALALINVLPYPVLDGGKWYMILIARLFKKRLSKNLETWAYSLSLLILLPLVVLICLSDVHNFF